MARPKVQALMVDGALNMLPPVVRRQLIEDGAFLEKWGLTRTVLITMGRSGPTFDRQGLFDAFREAIRNVSSSIEIKDRQNKSWRIVARQQDEALELSLEDEALAMSFADYCLLAADKAIRVAQFEKAANFAKPSRDMQQAWRSRLEGKPLEDDEFDDLTRELQLTPTNAFENLKRSFRTGEIDMATLVPRESRYYERLVGRLEDQKDVGTYVARSVKPLVSELVELWSLDGLVLALLLCSSESISAAINDAPSLSGEIIEQAAGLLEGDLISQIGLIEIGITRLDSNPSLEPILERMVIGMIDENPKDEGGRFALLSALIVVVAGELARTKTLGSTPPFWFRQAAIAQASLVARALSESNMDIASVNSWVSTSGLGHIFFLQTLVDLRVEPRWLPEFVGAKQLKAELLGRIAKVAVNNDSKIKSTSLRRLLLAEDGALRRELHWPFPFLPGPLEGASVPQNMLPLPVIDQVNTTLAGEKLEANSFTGLVNAALLYDLPSDQSGLAAAALRRVKYSVEKSEDETLVFGMVMGLAIVACVTRSVELADELRVLSRVIRRRRSSVDPNDEFRVALIAAASRRDLDGWASFAGDWITEIALELTDRLEASKLLPKVRRLVRLEAALARHCAIGETALAGFSQL
ncbi:MAG: hypothetical protein JSR89_18270 [Proteobacteria bacterium]|nr:hypothetical protein [Pseudomonadota bacterium]